MSLKLEFDQYVATLTIDRPESKNAFSLPMWLELIAACETVANAREVRVAILRASGDSFSAGGDFHDFAGLDSSEARTQYLRTVLAAYAAWERLAIPTIAVVDGIAAGGGCELAMVSDIVVATDRARFGLPEARFGLVPGVAVNRGRSRVSPRFLDYLIYTGRLVTAQQAREAGLVTITTTSAELEGMVAALTQDVVAQAPGALAAAKRAAVTHHSPGGYDLAAERIPELMGTPEHREGLESFAAGRAPHFGTEDPDD